MSEDQLWEASITGVGMLYNSRGMFMYTQPPSFSTDDTEYTPEISHAFSILVYERKQFAGCAWADPVDIWDSIFMCSYAEVETRLHN